MLNNTFLWRGVSRLEIELGRSFNLLFQGASCADKILKGHRQYQYSQVASYDKIIRPFGLPLEQFPKPWLYVVHRG